MNMHKGEVFASRDIYLDYDFEVVTHRWDHRAALTYMRFYGTAECPEPVAYRNRLSNDALRFGQETSREGYKRGFPFR